MINLKFRRIAALFLTGLLTTAGFSVKADTSGVVMSGNDNQITLRCDEDLFNNFKNMMPGQTAKQVIQIENTGEETLTLYLRAENAQRSDFNNEEQCLLSQELIKQFQLTVRETGADESNNSLIYSGSVSGQCDQGKMAANVSLGSFQKNTSAQIIATMSVPQNIGNRYQNTSAKVRWIFVAEGKNKTVEIPVSPETGDNTKSTVLLLAAVSFILVLTMLLAAKKKRREYTI